MSSDLKMEKRKINKLTLFSVVLFILVALWLVISVRNAGNAAEKSRSDSLYRTVMHSVSLCYSIEGEYPPDLGYLEENYGVKIAHDRYIVHYEYFGANIRPTITIVEKSANGNGKAVSEA